MLLFIKGTNGVQNKLCLAAEVLCSFLQIQDGGGRHLGFLSEVIVRP